MSDLHRLLYCSRNTIEGSAAQVEAEIRGILERSRANNRRDGVTGGLVFSRGMFAQVLEGPAAAVARTFERIQRDPRHGEVTMVHACPAACRYFADWSMAFAGTGDNPIAGTGDNPLAGVALDGAAADRSAAGGELLALMRRIVVREEAWAMASA